MRMKGKKTGRTDSSQKIDLYTLVAPFYDLLVGPFLKSVRKGIVQGADTQKCHRILDVACGTGEQAIMLANAGLEVAGVDLSPAMLQVAREKSPPGVSYALGNGNALPFDSGTFDCVTISLALHEMAHDIRTATTNEMLRVLAPGGKMIVFDYAALNRWMSALGLALMGLLERITGGEHFRNFVRYTQKGGVEQFIKTFPLKFIRNRSHFLGALRLVFLEKEHAAGRSSLR